MGKFLIKPIIDAGRFKTQISVASNSSNMILSLISYSLPQNLKGTFVNRL